MSATTGSEPSQDHKPADRRGEQTNLDFRYGSIGISAVAAALPYAGAGKNPAYAPVVPELDRRFAELMA